jgi:hypothetical protein
MWKRKHTNKQAPENEKVKLALRYRVNRKDNIPRQIKPPNLQPKNRNESLYEQAITNRPNKV